MCQELLEIPAAEDKHESCIAALRALVNKHQRIIAFADSVENVFCYASLMQFLSNTLVICFLGLLIVTVSKIRYLRSFRTAFCNLPELVDSKSQSLDSNAVLIKAIPYYIIVNIEAFILCYTGEYLSSKVRKRRSEINFAPPV